MELIKGYICTVTSNNINIKDSYKVKKKSEMKDILYAIQHNHSGCPVFKRSYNALLSEWKTHNRLYALGFQRARTKDVDLNYPIKWYVQLAYYIIGI